MLPAARMTEIVLFFTHDLAGAIFHVFIIVIRSKNSIDGAASFFCFWFRAWMFEAVLLIVLEELLSFAQREKLLSLLVLICSLFFLCLHACSFSCFYLLHF